MTDRVGRAWRKLPRRLRLPFSIVATTIRLYMDDSCSTYAAAIAYYAVFSLIPLTLITVSIIGIIVKQQSITQFIFDQFPLKETPSVYNSVEQIVQQAHDISPAGLSFGVLALVWSSTGIFSAVRRGLNAAAHRKRQRSYLHGKLIDITLVPALGILILLSVGLTAASQVIVDNLGSAGPFDFSTNVALLISSYVIPAVLSFGMFALLYKYVPTVRPGWAETLIGAAFATVLFEVTKNFYAMIFALTAFSKDTAIYAGFGNALGFLLWLFLNASLLLLGAEFGRAVRQETSAAGQREEVKTAPPVDGVPAHPVF